MNKGFTLVEIMIVTAILGVLSSIAIASYIIYSKKAIVSIALSEISSLQAEYEIVVNENYSNSGDLSNIKLNSSKYCILEINTPDVTTKIAEKAIVCNLNNTNLFSPNAMIYLSRNKNSNYTCYTKNIDQDYIPKSCFSE